MHWIKLHIRPNLVYSQIWSESETFLLKCKYCVQSAEEIKFFEWHMLLSYSLLRRSSYRIMDFYSTPSSFALKWPFVVVEGSSKVILTHASAGHSRTTDSAEECIESTALVWTESLWMDNIRSILNRYA